MEPLEVFELKDKCAYPVVYTGPLYRLRPFVKWAVILYWIVIVGISALILREERVGSAILKALPVTGICVAWLYPTRTRREWRPIPVRLTFGPEELVWDYPASPVIEKGKVIEQWEQYVMPYREISSLHRQMKFQRIDVWGTVSSRIWKLEPDGKRKAAPHFQKTAKNAGQSAYLDEYNPPGTVDQILEALVRHTGKPVEQHG